ncbi:MAG: hypothetical protein ACK544_18480, partial [Microcystis sp.]
NFSISDDNCGEIQLYRPFFANPWTRLRDVFFQVKRENRHQKRKLAHLRLGKFSTSVQNSNCGAAM